MRRFSRPAALLTALALLFSLALPAAAAAESITIASVQDFEEFSQQCTRDTWSRGITVELTADLDLSGIDFDPVPIFQGTFHGNGHTISGVSVQQKGSKSGLFRTLTESAAVEDLTVEGALAPQGSASQAGLLAGENYGAVRRCTSRGTVTGQEDVGGLVGLNGEGGVLTACANAADVTGITNVGGLTGRNLGIVENCSNSGTLNTQADQDTPTSVGGIAGLSRGTIRGCTNDGPVGYQHVGYNMGGIAGLQSGEISGCVNTAPVQGRKDVGGIVGQFEPSTNLTYGPSPSEQLSTSLSALFSQLEHLTSQLNDMVDRGLDDVQAVHDSLTAIQDRAHSAGTEGREDFRAMSDQLYQHTTAISGSLDALREAFDRFQNAGTIQIQEALDQSDRLLSLLGNLMGQADSGVTQIIRAMEDTLAAIRSQLEEIAAHRQALTQELEALKQYAADVARLVAAGQYDQALQIPFPAVDLTGHFSAISEAVEQSVRLAAQLPSQWADLQRGISAALGQTGTEMAQAQDALDQALTALDQAWDTCASSAQKHLDTVSQRADQIRELLKTYTDTLGDKAQSAVDDIDRELTAIQERVDGMTQAADADNAALRATSQAILDQMEAVRRAIVDLGREPELTVTDLTDEMDQGPGLIKDCSVSGTVTGDTHVGGIVGTVSAELGDDPEATFDLGDLKLMSDVYATLRAVVRGCRFDGAVTVKNECGGGIAGRCEAGAIVDCAARGTVETGGDYCGGIAGRTRGKVMRCAALIDLTGESWLGGVAGLGQDISDCRTMVRADSDGEYQGAIAGQAEGALSGNRYLLEDLAGLDGVDYEDRAQGMDFSAFSELDYIPADFLTFSYRFEVNGKTVAEIPFTYGSDLDLSQVPQAPQANGQYGQWPQFPTQNLRRSMVLQIQFADSVSTLSDCEGVAGLLVEGTFSPEAALVAHREEASGQEMDGCVPRFVWNYSVTGSQSDTLTVRLHTDGVKHPAAAVERDGRWERVDAVLDGSYLVFSGPVQGKILLMEEPPSLMGIVLAIAGGAAALAAAGILIRRGRRRMLPACTEENDPAALPR